MHTNHANKSDAEYRQHGSALSCAKRKAQVNFVMLVMPQEAAEVADKYDECKFPADYAAPKHRDKKLR